MRKTGILMAISSLPSSYGIGDLGPTAFSFVDYLVKAKIKIWQILPFNGLGYGNSPYQTLSSIAGDEIFISIDNLVEDGFLSLSDISYFKEEATQVAYDEVRLFKTKYLRKAFTHFVENYKLYEKEYLAFLNDNHWVYDYSVFLTLKEANNRLCWTDWVPEHREWIVNRDLDLSNYDEDIKYNQFLQFIFFSQWYRLKNYANSNGVEIMGDIPYYVGIDSLDVWANRQYFLLDDEGNPTHVAGVPPDYFSRQGQRWGNPIYDWDAIAKDDYCFWVNRLEMNMKIFDIIRIDHFRAFDTYWKIPASSSTAVTGEWIEAPGHKFFKHLFKRLPNIRLVVEDLGDMRPEVFELRDAYKFTGMKIKQFTLDPSETNNDFKDKENLIVYTGTHDNQTIAGWYLEKDADVQEEVKEYLDGQGYEGDIVDQVVQYTLASTAKLAIIPVQDILGLDDSARMNVPGTIGSPNWEWKLADYEVLEKKLMQFRHWVIESRRCEDESCCNISPNK